MKKPDLRRRDFFKFSAAGLTGAVFHGRMAPLEAADVLPQVGSRNEPLRRKVLQTPLIDTHEHLMNESERIKAGRTIGGTANDWTFLLSHYFDSDLASAGMSQADLDRFFSAGPAPRREMETDRAVLASREIHGLRAERAPDAEGCLWHR